MEREAATLINHTRTTLRIAVPRSPWDGGTPAVPSGDAVLPRLMRHLEESGSDVLEKELASDGMDSRSYPYQIAEMPLCRGPCRNQYETSVIPLQPFVGQPHSRRVFRSREVP